MVEHARECLLSIQIALELLTVVARTVGNFGGGDRNAGRVARAHLVRHHEHQIGVGNQCNREGSLAATLVAVSENSLQWPVQLKSGIVQLVEVSFLVARLWLGFLCSSWTPVIGVFQADCLVIEDLDLLEHMILLQDLQDRSVNLTKEFASVERILGDDDETVVVDHIAFN